MFADPLGLQQHSFHVAALLPVLTGIVVAFLGVAYVVREGGSRYALPYLAMALSAAGWMIADGIAKSVGTTALARSWYEVGHAALVLFPPSFLWFTHKVAGPLPAARHLLRVGAIITVALMTATLFGRAFIADVAPMADVNRAIYGWLGAVFCALYVLSMLVAVAVYYTRALGDGNSKSGRRRARLLGICALIGALFSASFLPANGVPVYIEGHWIMACFFALTAYVIGRYRVNDITPALIGAQIATTMTDALLVVDRQGNVHQMNPAAERLFGRGLDEAGSMSVHRLIGSDALKREMLAMSNQRATSNAEVTIEDGSGSLRTVSISASTIREYDQSARAFIFILRDISSRREAEERVRELAYFDSLTGLPNRTGFNEKLADLLTRAPENPLTLLFLDLDRFKRVNDTLGHAAGDKLLGVIARRLQHCLRQDSSPRTPNDQLIARLGGDEFVIGLPGIDDIDVIIPICERLVSALAQPIDLNGQEVFTGASIGVSRYPNDATDANTLLKTADLALYAAKDAGRSNYQFYNAAMDRHNRERVSMEADIRRALDNNEFDVHYQPLVDNRTDHIVGAEGLVRWKHSTRGDVAPDLFVPIAEEAGLIAILGERVLYRACAAVQHWHGLGYPNMTVAVNVSDHQFRRHNLLQVVRRCIDESGVPASALILELTESTIMNDESLTIRTLGALKELGVRISVDDFGTGCSSMTHLKRFPIDIIKVDSSFTRGIGTSDNAAAITQAIIGMARTLHLQVIAEGVEAPSQLAFLSREQCHFMQGYLFGAPRPLDEFTRMLADSRKSNAQSVPTLSLPGLTIAAS